MIMYFQQALIMFTKSLILKSTVSAQILWAGNPLAMLGGFGYCVNLQMILPIIGFTGKII